MAKCEKNGITMIRFLITAGILLVATVTSFAWVKFTTTDNTKTIGENKVTAEKDITNLKKDGTTPAQENTIKIAIIETTMTTVKEDVKEVKGDIKNMRLEQSTYHTEIMEAIRER